MNEIQLNTVQLGDAHQIFISYCHVDIQFALQLKGELERCGYIVWLDTSSIPGGDIWLEQISQGIDEAFAMISIISKNANESKWMRREYLYADEQGKDILPVIIDGSNCPFYMMDRQAVIYSGDFDRFFLSVKETMDRWVPSADQAGVSQKALRSTSALAHADVPLLPSQEKPSTHVLSQRADTRLQAPSPALENFHPDIETTQIKEQKPLLVLCGQSLRPITRDEIMSSLGEEAKSRPIEIIYLDFTDLETNWIMDNPEVAVQRLTNPQGPLHKALKRRKEVDFAFYGLMRIPLAFLIGHLIPGSQPMRLFDIQPYPDSALETWMWPGPGDPFPPLEVQGIPRRKNIAKSVVAIGISISFTVFPSQIRAVGLHDALIVDLKLPHPKRGIIRSEEQVRAYGHTFRSILDLLIERSPAIKCIHVFYAGPMALAFHSAQQIAGDIHPPVIAWNFRPGGYDWGINLAEASFGNPSIVYPLGPTFPKQENA